MSHSLKAVFKRKRAIILLGVLCAFLSFALTLLFPLKHRADAQILIITKSRFGVDPYTIVKSAERVGENLARVINTTDFYTKVRSYDYGIDWSVYDSAKTEKKRRKLWQKNVSTGVVYGTGILSVSTFDQDPAQALTLAASVSDTLVRRGWEYVGGDVSMKIVNDPVVTQFPVKPNPLTNGIAGLVFGLLLGSVLAVRLAKR